MNSFSNFQQTKTRKVFTIGFIILIWYTSSALSNTLSKDIFQLAPLPLSLTTIQFGLISFFCFLILRVFKLYPFKSTPLRILYKKIYLLVLSATIARFFTQFAILNAEVSFVHTTKASAPIFSVFITKYILKENIDKSKIIATIPIVMGVSLSTISEFLKKETDLQLNFVGFCAAILATIIFCGQNIYSKKLFQDDQSISSISLLYYLSLGSFILLIPITLIVEGTGVFYFLSLDNGLIKLYILNGIAQFIQNISAFTALSSLSALGYSITNTFKRIFVIVVAFVYFGNPLIFTNFVGILFALVGLVIYNFQGKRKLKELPV